MMRKVLHLEDLLRMEADAVAALLAVRLSEGGTANDEALLHAWLDADARHSIAWNRTQRVWQGFDAAKNHELFAGLREAASIAGPKHRHSWAGLAASVALIALCLGSIFYVRHGSWNSQSISPSLANREPAAQTYTTDKFELARVELSDGTRLTLDGDTTVAVSFSDARRDIQLLRGHAYVVVAKDTTRPLIVAMEDSLVTAIGTVFDVRREATGSRIVLLEGKVAVESTLNTFPRVILQEGQALTIVAGNSTLASDVDIEAIKDWERGLVTFSNASLSAAVEEITRGTADRIVIDDPEIAAMRISGRFRTRDVERFGRSLAEVYPVRILQTAPHQFVIVHAKSAAR